MLQLDFYFGTKHGQFLIPASHTLFSEKKGGRSKSAIVCLNALNFDLGGDGSR